MRGASAGARLTAVFEAPSFGKPIVVYDVSSVGAQAYMAVARELIDRTAAASASGEGA
mgnify:CR=1 FL=1